MPTKKHVSRSGLVRGKTTAAIRHVDLPGGIKIPGRWPVLLVTIHTGYREHWWQFRKFCQENGISFNVAGDQKPPKVERWVDGDGEEVPETDPTDPQTRPRGAYTVYEVSGGPSLEQLVEMPYVKDWVWPLDVGEPRFNSSTSRRGWWS